MTVEMKQYEEMSPFEFKNVLIKMAENGAKAKNGKVLNAGRGNPNFLNTMARIAFNHLNLFATDLASKNTNIENLGLKIKKEGITKKFDEFLNKLEDKKISTFLKDALRFCEKKLKLNPDDLVHELADASLGDFYPSPPRIFPNVEKIIFEYLNQVLFNGELSKKGNFHLFATEGATAAMIYIFDSLKENKILKKGDHIGIITPIFSPYLEIPPLNDYQLVEIYIQGSEEEGWQIPDSEIKKLEDPKIKALFFVNPSNPPSVALKKETLEKIEKIVSEKRKDLIALTDTVYATFSDEYNSIVGVIPKNTICVYSFSKYFGVTGWRLGIIMLHENNIIDELISKLPKIEVSKLDDRYKMDSAEPEKIKFIERLVMDSRDVALAHTGGLSCPQQCIMSLFALFELLDTKKKYRKSIQSLLLKRITDLYTNLEIKFEKGPEHTYYYTLLNIGKMAKEKYGDEFAQYFEKNVLTIEFLIKLAKEKFTICLPGEGFAGPKSSIRIALANLESEAYPVIGKNIKDVMQEYYDGWKK
ncbi:bifunctional aspartate transaminase/aspartate 4-decarboxylase [Candidatus Dependentiae bacterium]|nr:bifunctional aspartate transaminase/aspartate 4-decarboxylase [Candidatus Dependentiae bacterium]